MKYTVIDPTSEKKLAVLDSDSKEWKGFQFEKTGDFVRVTGVDSQVSIVGVAQAGKDRQFMISSSLGCVTVQIERGEPTQDIGAGGNSKKTLKSQMPGKVLRLMCKVGDTVKAGDAVLVIEAMKMENEIKSPKDGVVEKLLVAVGKTIESGESLMVIV